MSRPVPTPEGAGAVVLFDGVCNLCHGAVTFILDRDGGAFRFASLQSPAGRAFLAQAGLPADYTDGFVLVEGGRVYTRSDAALRVARRLRGAWPLLAAFRVVPRPVRDWAYDAVARSRYRLFGRRDACRLPTPELQGRFLSET